MVRHYVVCRLRPQVVNATDAKPKAPPPTSSDCLKTAVPWFREFTFACSLEPVPHALHSVVSKSVLLSLCSVKKCVIDTI